tara:strand:+ start:4315 stop:4533 length:219 start_codon:yes stop_codon:yes gene_type:complete
MLRQLVVERVSVHIDAPEVGVPHPIARMLALNNNSKINASKIFEPMVFLQLNMLFVEFNSFYQGPSVLQANF